MTVQRSNYYFFSTTTSRAVYYNGMILPLNHHCQKTNSRLSLLYQHNRLQKQRHLCRPRHYKSTSNASNNDINKNISNAETLKKSSESSSTSTSAETSTTFSFTSYMKNILQDMYKEFQFVSVTILRLASAFSIAYIVSEYCVDITICEGPSMLPTIYNEGEIVLLDRLTPRLYGLSGGGCSGSNRRLVNRTKQKEYEQEQQELQLQQISSTKTTSSAAKDSSGDDNDNDDNNEKQMMMSMMMMKKATAPPINTWYEPYIPVNELPRDGAWERFWQRVTTGISVGDVVVVQHPDRIGTVCKRVRGLPGDIVTKDTTTSNSLLLSKRQKYQQEQQRRQHHHPRLQRRRSALLVVPDGHVWLEGDNPSNSTDSRTYGPIPANLIVGRVLLRLWPIRGNALMERGDRPSTTTTTTTKSEDDDDTPQSHPTYSGTLILPAGYNDQLIVRHLTSPKGSEQKDKRIK